jgi:hypothetical protein
VSLEALVVPVTTTARFALSIVALYCEFPFNPQFGGISGLLFWIGITAVSAAFSSITDAKRSPS